MSEKRTALRGYLAYTCMEDICKECLFVDKMCLRTELSRIPRGNKGFDNLLKDYFCPK